MKGSEGNFFTMKRPAMVNRERNRNQESPLWFRKRT